jgi:hypothetical protein
MAGIRAFPHYISTFAYTVFIVITEYALYIFKNDQKQYETKRRFCFPYTLTQSLV